METPALDRMVRLVREEHTQVIGQFLEFFFNEGWVFLGIDQLNHAKVAASISLIYHDKSAADWVHAWEATDGVHIFEPDVREKVEDFINYQFFERQRIVVQQSDLATVNRNIQEWLAEWVGIDLQRVEEERMALLNDIRKTNELRAAMERARELR